jgi:hypothetical protein
LILRSSRRNSNIRTNDEVFPPLSKDNDGAPGERTVAVFKRVR